MHVIEAFDDGHPGAVGRPCRALSFMLHAQVWYPSAPFGSSGCAELVWDMLHTRPWHLTAASNPPGHTAGLTELLPYCELAQRWLGP